MRCLGKDHPPPPRAERAAYAAFDIGAASAANAGDINYLLLANCAAYLPAFTSSMSWQALSIDLPDTAAL